MKITTYALFLIAFSILTVKTVLADGTAGSGDVLTEDAIAEKAIDDQLAVDKKGADKPTDVEVTKPTKAKAETQKSVDNASAISPMAMDQSTPVPAKKKKPKKDSVGPKKITSEEAEFLTKMEQSGLKNVSPDADLVTKDDPKGKFKIYKPAPVMSQLEKHTGFVVERDSPKIVRKRLAYTDALDVYVCFQAGVQIILDDDIQVELQRELIDDNLFFSATDLENHRGIYVHLKSPIPEGKHFESAVRLARRDNDKTYLIKLLGVPCNKDGLSPFPEVIYLKEKFPGIASKNTRLMTPEDTIIEMSGGMARKNVNKIEVRDMLARSSSDWVVFSVQVQLPADAELDPKKLPIIKVLDNWQISEMPTKVEYLPIASKKATEELGRPTARFKVVVGLDKAYLNDERYIHMMFIDKENDYYQYIRVDTANYVKSLRERGFDI